MNFKGGMNFNGTSVFVLPTTQVQDYNVQIKFVSDPPLKCFNETKNSAMREGRFDPFYFWLKANSKSTNKLQLWAFFGSFPYFSDPSVYLKQAESKELLFVIESISVAFLDKQRKWGAYLEAVLGDNDKRFFVTCREMPRGCTRPPLVLKFDPCPEILAEFLKFRSKFEFGTKNEKPVFDMKVVSESKTHNKGWNHG